MLLLQTWKLKKPASEKALFSDVGVGPSRALDLAGGSAVYIALSREGRRRETLAFRAGVLEERARDPHFLLWGTFSSHQSGGNAKPGGPATPVICL